MGVKLKHFHLNKNFYKISIKVLIINYYIKNNKLQKKELFIHTHYKKCFRPGSNRGPFAC